MLRRQAEINSAKELQEGKTIFVDNMPSDEEISLSSANVTIDESWATAFDWENRDARLDGFPLMDSILPTIFISSAYLIMNGLLILGKLK